MRAKEWDPAAEQWIRPARGVDPRALEPAIQQIADDVSRIFTLIDLINELWKQGKTVQAMDMLDDLREAEQALCHPTPSTWLWEAMQQAMAEALIQEGR